MSTEQIKQLHEQASEKYLNGDYDGALQAWRDVLNLDPANEEAQDGVRMASQFVAPAPAAPTPPSAPSDLNRDLDEGLKVLDGIGAATLDHPDTVDGAIDLKPAPPLSEAPATEEILEGWETPAHAAAEEPSYGLEPFARPAMAPSNTEPSAPAQSVSAAAGELKRRVNDLLAEAKAKADAGEREEALAILSRLAILDEENAEATELRAKIEAESASDLDRVERAIIEGVAALEADNLDVAEKHFREALALAPEHREAQHYLEKIAERRSSSSEELLAAPAVGESAPADNAVSNTVPLEAPQIKPAAAAAKPPRVHASPPPEPPPAAIIGSRSSARSSKLLLYSGAGLLVLVGAAILLPRLLGGHGAKGPLSVPLPAAGKAPARAASEPNPAKSPAAPSTRPIPSDPAEHARQLSASLQKGRALLASGDFGGAVLAYNDALALDPANSEAKLGMDDATARYKARKADQDAMDKIAGAFKDGEYSSALRMAYRLPPTIAKSYADAVKVAGWYNLAVVALRAGDCKEAISRLDDALEIAPSDADAKSLRELSSRYADAVKDRGFLDRVEALAFRPLPRS